MLNVLFDTTGNGVRDGHPTKPGDMSADEMTLAHVLEANAFKYGDRIGYVQAERSLTHRQYLSRARRLADGLYQRNARSQDRIAVLSMNCLEYLEAYGACEVSGFIITTVNYRLAAPEMLAILTDAAPKVLIFESRYLALVDQLRTGLPDVDCYVCIGGSAPVWALDYESLIDSGSPAGPPIRPRASQVAHLIYTSGTTGRPKGCMLGHRQLVDKAQLHAGDMDPRPDDKLLIVMPLFHVGARGVVGAAQWRGAAIYLLRSFEPERYLNALAEQGITMAHLAPTMVKDVLDHELVYTLDLSRLRLICYSAAPMPLPTLRRGLELLGPVFHQSYGQTEGMVSSLLRSQHLPDGNETEKGWLLSVGQPYPRTEVRIVDDDGNPVAIGSVGEITYRGPFTFSGYWNDSVSTLATIRDGWVHSGDIGRLDDGGFLYIVDRKKDMIVSGGENIYSRDVEDALLKHEFISEAAVIGVPDERWGEAVHAYLVCAAQRALTQEDVIEHCRSLIASYKRPRSATFVEALPRTANGKVDKRALRLRHSEGRS